MTASPPVLVVGLRNGNNVAGVSPTIQVGLRTIAPEACFRIPPSQPVKLAALNLIWRRAVWHPDGVQVEVRLRTLGEGIHVLEAVLRSRPESSWDSVGLRPDVGLDPAPPLTLEGDHKLIHVRMPLA